MALNLVHQTKEQFIAKLRDRYLVSQGEKTATLVNAILSRIDSGDLTGAEMRTAFGLNAGQWTTLKAKMEDVRLAHSKIKTAKGE